jgi:predicted flap endonuclease-1-like 5' DNA nuclease
MADQPSNEIDLETFLKAAGQSFTDAQRTLLPGQDVPVNMMLNTAELELRVGINTDALGRMTIRPISASEILSGNIDAGTVSTIRVNFVSALGEVNAPVQTGTNAPGTATPSIRVPSVVGLTLDEAAAVLKESGWTFRPHAATAEEIAASGADTRGTVLRQQPAASQPADKGSTTVEFWTDLGTAPVKDIDGIGEKTSATLDKLGIRSVGELSLADVNAIASQLRINETRARNLVDMAALMSRLAVMGFKDEVVELLVKGAGLRSVQDLAVADARTLFRTCQEAVSTGKVQTPKEFSFTLRDVQGWIKTAAG